MLALHRYDWHSWDDRRIVFSHLAGFAGSLAATSNEMASTLAGFRPSIEDRNQLPAGNKCISCARAHTGEVEKAAPHKFAAKAAKSETNSRIRRRLMVNQTACNAVIRCLQRYHDSIQFSSTANVHAKVRPRGSNGDEWLSNARKQGRQGRPVQGRGHRSFPLPSPPPSLDLLLQMRGPLRAT